MQLYSKKTQLCFDDILLVPASYSTIKSRYDVDLTMRLGLTSRPLSQIELSLPIIGSPMNTVCEWEMAQVLADHGALGIIHRFMKLEDRIDHLNRVNGLVGVAISLSEAHDAVVISKLLETNVRVMCIDTANGHASRAISAVNTLRKSVPDHIHIMCGNVSTINAHHHLLEAGADSVRVGIGGGSACTTRIVSGHGMPTLASIMECRSLSSPIHTGPMIANHDCSIIADGGIRSTGDMIKAFAAGASAVMLGSMLSGYEQSPGEKFHDSQGRLVKNFQGMASKEAQESWLGGVSVSEGISTIVPYKGDVKELLQSIRGGLGSGCSYSNCGALRDLYYTAEYIEVTSASVEESMPHAANHSWKNLANITKTTM